MTIVTLNSTYDFWAIGSTGDSAVYRNGAYLGILGEKVGFRVTDGGTLAHFTINGLGPVRTSFVQSVRLH